MQAHALVLSLVLPGAGQILAGRPLRGVVFCVVFAALLAAALVRATFLGAAAAGDELALALAAPAAAVWLAAQGELVWQAYRRRRREQGRPERDRHFAAGVNLFLRGEAAAATLEFRRALRLDATDADAWFYLAETLAAQGQADAARRARARCAAADGAGKWRDLVAAPA